VAPAHRTAADAGDADLLRAVLERLVVPLELLVRDVAGALVDERRREDDEQRISKRSTSRLSSMAPSRVAMAIRNPS
jgi:hypothetical protein